MRWSKDSLNPAEIVAVHLMVYGNMEEGNALLVIDRLMRRDKTCELDGQALSRELLEVLGSWLPEGLQIVEVAEEGQP